MATETVGYTDAVVKVEPKGIEHVADSERHGRPGSVFSLWFGANVELATLSTGVAAVVLFGLNFTEAAIGLIIGNILGALVIGALSTYGPRLGVPQMVHSRSAFGFFGNFIPGGLNTIAGVMWFGVNTVLGVFALVELTGMSFLLGLILMAGIQVVVAVYGHNMIHAVERWLWGVLTLVFIGVSLYAFAHAPYNLPFNSKAFLGFEGVSGGVIEAVGLAFSYILGWTAYASDYTRYLPTKVSARRVAGLAGGANFVASLWLELVGVALAAEFPKAAQGANPVGILNGISPHWLVVVALVAVALGTITANVLNIYSSSLSSLVVRVPIKRWTAAVLVGVVGAVVAWLGHTAYYLDYENFLFLLAYWIAPWAAIVLVDFFVLHRGRYHTDLLYAPARVLRPGFWAWIIGVVVSVPFFNQTLYTGFIAHNNPHLGDLSYYVSFVVAGGLYWIFGRDKARVETPAEAS